MAYETALQSISVPASADLSTHQYCLVVVNSSGQLAVAAADQAAIGVLQDVPNAAGRVGRVAVGGISKCVFGGSVTKGAQVVSDANGHAVTAGSSDGYIIGTAPDGGASGGVYALLIQPIGK